MSVKTVCKRNIVGLLDSVNDLLKIYGHKLQRKANQHNESFFSMHIKLFRCRHKVDSELDLTGVRLLPGKYGSDGRERRRNQSPGKKT